MTNTFLGSGIGRGIAIQLAKQGCRLVLWDINEEGNQETAAEIKKFGGQAHPYSVDVSNREEVYRVAAQVGSIYIHMLRQMYIECDGSNIWYTYITSISTINMIGKL